MTSREIAAHRIAARMGSNSVGIDPALIPILVAVVAELVKAIRACYKTPDSAFAYLTRDFGPLMGWRKAVRDRLVNEAIDDAVDQQTVAVNTFAFGSELRPEPVKDAIRSALRDDLSRGLLADLYREQASA